MVQETVDNKNQTASSSSERRIKDIFSKYMQLFKPNVAHKVTDSAILRPKSHTDHLNS